MSNALAIAHVTQALALLIENNLRPEIDMAVSVETRKPPAEPPTEPTLNVFLHQVTPNPSRRNDDLVTRSSDGTLLKRPAAALDLHYVISAYGEETELVGQRLIGSVVRTLHEIPVLPQDVIETAGERPYLDGSDLAEAEQRVRFTPRVMDIDETSKLWGMLHQTPYALSVVYTGTLVLIDGRERPAPAQPVRTRTVRALPFGAPGAPVPPVIGEYPLPGEEDAGGDDGGEGSAKSAARTGSGRAATATAARTAKATKSAKTAKKVAKRSASKSAASKAAAPKATASKATASKSAVPSPASSSASAEARPADSSAPAKSARSRATSASRAPVKSTAKTTAAVKRARKAATRKKPDATADGASTTGPEQGQGESRES